MQAQNQQTSYVHHRGNANDCLRAKMLQSLLRILVCMAAAVRKVFKTNKPNIGGFGFRGSSYLRSINQPSIDNRSAVDVSQKPPFLKLLLTMVRLAQIPYRTRTRTNIGRAIRHCECYKPIRSVALTSGDFLWLSVGARNFELWHKSAGPMPPSICL